MFESCLLKYRVASNKYPIPSTTYTLKVSIHKDMPTSFQNSRKKTLWFQKSGSTTMGCAPKLLRYLGSSRVYCGVISVTTGGALYCTPFHPTKTCSTNFGRSEKHVLLEESKSTSGFTSATDPKEEFFITHSIHGTGIFTYIYHKNQPFM